MKQSLSCTLANAGFITGEIFFMEFGWNGTPPRAGQFFMVKPKRSAVFLGRPVSLALWNPPAKTVKFLIAVRGAGTNELAEMRTGEEAELTGPLGNAWADFLPDKNKSGGAKAVALVGGGIGIAPLEALLAELPGYGFDFYAGFKTGFKTPEEKHGLLGPAVSGAENVIIATENGSKGKKGRIPDFLAPEKYRAVCVCGPQVMLEVVAARCKAAAVPCFASLERRMACGVGACLGCTVVTVNGIRRCCADGPIFDATDVFF